MDGAPARRAPVRHPRRGGRPPRRGGAPGRSGPTPTRPTRTTRRAGRSPTTDRRIATTAERHPTLAPRQDRRDLTRSLIRRTASRRPRRGLAPAPGTDGFQALGPQGPLLHVVEGGGHRSRGPRQEQVGEAGVARQGRSVRVGAEHQTRTGPLRCRRPTRCPHRTAPGRGVAPRAQAGDGGVVLEPGQRLEHHRVGRRRPIRCRTGCAASSPTARRPDPFTVTTSRRPTPGWGRPSASGNDWPITW